MTANFLRLVFKNRLDVSKEFCQSVKVCHLLVKDGVSGHLPSMLLISLDQLFVKNSANLSKCAIFNVSFVKTKSATISFFLFSSFPSPGSSFSLFLFFRYFDFGASRA